MDVEGHEYIIIRGCYNVMKRHLPDLLIEMHPTLLGEHKLIDLLFMLRDLGYKIKHFIQRNIDVPLTSHKNDIFDVDIDKLILCPPEWNFTLYLKHLSKKKRSHERHGALTM